MKWLNSKLGSGTYAAGISGITSNYDSNHRQIVTAHAKGEFVEAMWNMVDRTSSDAWRQQREIFVTEPIVYTVFYITIV